MTRHEKRGTRDELIAHLDDTAMGAFMLTSDKFSQACDDAADQLRDGADEVKAGQTTYRVAE